MADIDSIAGKTGQTAGTGQADTAREAGAPPRGRGRRRVVIGVGSLLVVIAIGAAGALLAGPAVLAQVNGDRSDDADRAVGTGANEPGESAGTISAGDAAEQVQAPQGPPPAPVVVTPVFERMLRRSLSFVGSTMAARESAVAAEVSGRITAVLVDDGETVDAGEILARIDAGRLDFELRAAEAELTLRKSELTELENGTRAELRAEAAAQVARAEAELKYRVWKREQSQALRRTNDISENILQEDVQLEAIARADLARAKALQALSDSGPRSEDLDQARARVTARTIEVDRLTDLVARHEIRAPFAGVVSTRHIEVGDWVNPGSTAYRLLETAPVDVRVGVPEQHIRLIGRGTDARIVFDALPGVAVVGKVRVVVPEADPTTRLFPVEVRLDNADGQIRPGMFARAAFAVVGEPTPQLMVPQDALVLGKGPQPLLVTVSQEDADGPVGVAGFMPVTVGAAIGRFVQVSAPGLTAGTLVVIEGNERNFPGQPLMITRTVPAPSDDDADADAQ
jgi:HlyD family secretion protein